MLLTVPHATQPENEQQRASDLAARGAARTLNKRLNDLGIVTVLLEGNVPRKECDLNRHGACSTEPGQFKYRYVMALRREPSLVMDMHSYPDGETWGLPFRTSAVVLYEPTNVTLAQSLVNALGNVTPAVAGVRGKTNENYIIVEASRRGVPALLLEVHEDRSYDTVIDATAAWVKRVIK